jgi:hypothetical protein
MSTLIQDHEVGAGGARHWFPACLDIYHGSRHCSELFSGVCAVGYALTFISKYD